MRDIVRVACLIAFAAGLTVAGDDSDRSVLNRHPPNFAHFASDQPNRPGGTFACGDGFTDPGEECDDGNTDDGDGCDATCQNECGGDTQEWNQIVRFDPNASFRGGTVSISGDTAVRGALVFERNAGGADAWGLVAELTNLELTSPFATLDSVSISGDTIVVGTGHSAFVFERNVGGAQAWGQVAKLTASDSTAANQFGFSVSVSGDTIVVGAYWSNPTYAGAAYVFERNAGGADAWGQVAKLTASDTSSYGMFGYSVAVGGDTIAVTSDPHWDPGPDTGSAYVFERNAGGAGAWRQVARLTASLPDNRFGRSVSVSGDTVVVGAFGDDHAGHASGAAYVFERRMTGDAWEQVARLTASDAAPGDLFGGSVSVSGDRIVVGAENDDRDPLPDTGATYVFERNEGGAGAWGQATKLTATDPGWRYRFGSSVSVSGNTVVVSDGGSGYVLEPGCVTCGDGTQEVPEECDDGAANSDTIPDACRADCTLPICGDGVTDSGEACDEGTSNSDSTPDTCRADCTLPTCGDGVTDAGEVCDDGNSDDGDGCGATCQNEFCGDGVVNDSGNELCDDGNTDDGDGCDATCQPCGDGIVNNSACDPTELARLTASDAQPWDEFGQSVSRSGDTIVVGAYRDDDAGSNSGSAYVFRRNVGGADAWGQIAKLTASDAAGSDYFGYSVAVSGDTVVVGAHRDDDGASNSGSAYVFGRNVGGPDAWGQVAKLTASDASRSDYFGFSVAVSGDAVAVLVDSRWNPPGSAYVFERNAGGVDAWGQVAKLTAADGGRFGTSIAISGDTVVVGALGDDDDLETTDPQSVHVFERDAGGAGAWGQVAELTASDATAGGRLGQEEGPTGDSAAIGPVWPDDRRVAIAAPQGSGGPGIAVSVGDDTIAMSASRNAYVFGRDVVSGAWGQLARLPGVFRSVAVSGDMVVAGTNHVDAATIFVRDAGGANAWGRVATLWDPANDGSNFGGSVSVGGNTIVVGASQDLDAGQDHTGTRSGSVYILTHVCEECDEGAANSDFMPDACRSDCKLPDCGDSVADSGEECDDGNNADGDGCTSTCRSEMSPNLIESGEFERRSPWRFFTDGTGGFRVVGEEAVVTIGNSGSNTQLFQRFGGLAAGTYKLDFDVRSSVITRARTILVNETDLSWIAQAGFRTRPAWSHVTSTLVVPADVPPGIGTARLSFFMPGVPNGTTLHLDNVVLRRVGPN